MTPATPSQPSPRPVCLFIPSFGDGGVERMMVNIARGIAGHGHPVDFVVNDAGAPFVDTLPPEVRVHVLAASGLRARTRFLAELVARTRPAAVLTAKTRDDRVALAVKRRLGGDTRYVLRPGTAMSERWRARGKGWLWRWRETRRLRALYRRADAVVAVSEGVAEDIVAITGIARERVRVIRNPNITPELAALAAAEVDHPWFAPGAEPVIMGVGGLRTQKDFETLIRAFARVRETRPCRLLILGEGRQRERLLRLAAELGVAEAVALPGFESNPYRFLARAALFALSSRWEGSPNVLTEALALGTPVVATDCRSGPREITRGGEYGPLVAVGDVAALAEAIERTLDRPLPAERLREAVAEYRLETSAGRYLEVFGLR
ncbi:glycosyltransferase [Marichromatium gracile]|uniref:Glycosyltransferase involved in cell wall biosynthesis n=1 Tax=Marichromatium gracile TaxID=1048 RepID=A0A4R4AKY3_MARGR|nr:glycosyltransferase [Marichromatium gracile]MBK1710422.1 glycosyl transferase [Marichromatium gracile]TCW40087.1 glycosyltransferase involved in cell wall biosynthesis [Marichromatium gracile]